MNQTPPQDTAPFNAGVPRILHFRGSHLTTDSQGRPMMSTNAESHRRALHENLRGFSTPMKEMLSGWEGYARKHKQRYFDLISADTALGPEWLAIGKALKGLLDGDTGGLDCGSISQNILECMEENGVDLGKEGLV